MICNLQSLRAFAAINVVFFHIIEVAERYGSPATLISHLDSWGASGVDIFFVLSGFVMLVSQQQSKRSVSDFYKSRLIRIVPTYWSLTTLVVIVFFMAPGLFRETVITAEWALASYFFFSGLLGEAHPIVYVGWTLEWEVLFYLVFGATLLLRSWYVSYLLIFLSLCVVAFLSSNTIVLEFLLGMIAACLYQKKLIGNKQGLVILLAGIVLLLASLSDSVKLLEIDRFFLWGIPSFLIVLGAVSVRQISHGVLSYLGDASYSIYLIQVLSIPVFYKLISQLNFAMNGDFLSVVCLIFSVCAGIGMYSLFEKPTISFLRVRSKRNRLELNNFSSNYKNQLYD